MKMMEAKPPLLPKEDLRPRRGLWAPGDYFCLCARCDKEFIGDKRAVYCADCAYAEQAP